jgi:hypothetical protein
MRFAMFGNGTGDAPNLPTTGVVEPPSSSSLWGDMFGLSGLIKTITDPALGAHAHQMMAAIIEGSQASARIEKKLNQLLEALGHDVADLERRNATPGFNPGAGPPALLAGERTHGSGGFAAASVAPDDGNRQPATENAADGDPSGAR